MKPKNSLTRADISMSLYNKIGYTKKLSKEIVEDVFSKITDKLLAGHFVKIPGFGTFSFRDKKARRGRNPQTGETITISARRVIAFKSSDRLKEKFKAE